jgi:hypothetical protein
VAQLVGVVDDSGIRITYTERLRRHDAGIMELGLIYSDANSIPPGEPVEKFFIEKKSTKNQ